MCDCRVAGSKIIHECIIYNFLFMQSSIIKLSAMFQKILSKSQRSQQRNVASDGATGFFPRMPSKNLWKSKENNQLSSLEDEVAANAI